MGFDRLTLTTNNWYEVAGYLTSFSVTTVGSDWAENVYKRKQ